MDDHSNNVCKENVFDKVFFNISGKLRNYLYYKCGDLEKSEDLVQDAFYKLWEKCKEVPPHLAQGFVFKVATNLLLNQIEKDKVHLRFTKSRRENSEENTPHFQLEYTELQQQLENAINQLPQGQKEVFLMNRMDKMTYAEIAKSLNLSVKAVEKRMHKALLELRKIIGKI